MAVFGAIASAAPNVLFDAAKVDRDVQGFARNQLLVSNAQQDQAQQTYQRDVQARIAAARELVNLPEDQAAAQWGTVRGRLQGAGFGQDLSEQFPGMEHIKAVASSDLTTFERLKLEEQRRAAEGLQSLFGLAPAAGPGGALTPAMSNRGGQIAAMAGVGAGQAPAMPVSMSAPLPTAGAAPIAGGSVRAGNADAAAQRDEAMRTLEGEPLQRRLAEISAGRAQALTGLGPNTQYRAPEGVRGVYAGVPAAPPGVPVLSSGPAPAGQASGGAAANPVFAGLTPEQTRRFQAAAVLPGANPAQLLAQIDEARRGNLTLTRQQEQDERQRRLDAVRDAREVERDRRAAAKDERTAPGGPIRGDGLNNSLMNTLITGDPNSPEYAAAYARLGAEEVNPATGAVRRPDMSPYRAPTYLPPGSALASGGMGMPPAGQPGTATAAAPAGGVNPPFASPPNALAPQAQGGREYGRAEFRPSTNTTSAGDRTKLRAIETEGQSILDALESYRAKRTSAGGVERVQSAFGLPTELNTSYNNLALLAKGEALYGLGVLNGPDLEILRRVAADPGTMAGGAAGMETVNAQLNQVKVLLQQRLATARQQYGGAEAASGQNDGQPGRAAPPAGPRPRLTFNPATGRIE